MTKSCTFGKYAYKNTRMVIKRKINEFIIVALYRHSNGKAEHFVHDMDQVLRDEPKRTNCFLDGDMNIDLLTSEVIVWHWSILRHCHVHN